MVVEKVKLLKGAAVASFVFSFCLLISTFVACGKCYVEPCYEGDGVATLWQLNRALGFQCVSSAFVSLAFAAYVIWFILRSSDDGKLRMVFGGGGLVMLMSLQTGALFGSQSLTMTQLQTHFAALVPPGVIFEQSTACLAAWPAPTIATVNLGPGMCAAVRGCAWNPNAITMSVDVPQERLAGQCQASMAVNDSARSTFDAVAAFSAINLLLQGGMLFLLRAGGGEFGGGHGSSYNDIAPPVS